VKLFKVVYDGPSRPIIETPNGKLLQVNAWQDGRWASWENEDKDCHAIVEALNWVILNGPILIAEGSI
jgi:hypothetical protein